MHNHHCRVCGYYLDDPPWAEDGHTPTYEICPCCAVEFGYEDYTVESAKQYRENWIRKGVIWFDPEQKPVAWDLQAQLKNVPPACL